MSGRFQICLEIIDRIRSASDGSAVFLLWSELEKACALGGFTRRQAEAMVALLENENEPPSGSEVKKMLLNHTKLLARKEDNLRAKSIEVSAGPKIESLELEVLKPQLQEPESISAEAYIREVSTLLPSGGVIWLSDKLTNHQLTDFWTTGFAKSLGRESLLLTSSRWNCGSILPTFTFDFLINYACLQSKSEHFINAVKNLHRHIDNSPATFAR